MFYDETNGALMFHNKYFVLLIVFSNSFNEKGDIKIIEYVIIANTIHHFVVII